jgi:polysaccharide biosynthesis protein PelA
VRLGHLTSLQRRLLPFDRSAGARHSRFFLLANIVLCLWQIAPALATDRLVKREILALFDSREDPQQLSHIHKMAEMPLNHLGYSVVYWDVERGLPDIRSIERYKGVLTWFGRDLAKPELYLPWAAEVVDRGLKLVILGQIGVPLEPRYLENINAILGDIGLKHTGQFVEVPFAAHVIVKDAAMMEFERKLDPVIHGFPLIIAERPDLVSHLTLASSRSARAQSSVLVATSPRGGYIADDFAFAYEAAIDRVSWIINPFNFFHLAFGPERNPIPDVTTLAGLRIYFSHIDGDGWNNVSHIEHFAKTGTLSSEVVVKELIEPYPDLPVSVGLIAGDVDPELGGDPAGRPIARRLFALPHVEVASHTHTHPYNWQYFERYQREDENKLIEGQQRVERRVYDRAIGSIMKLAKKEKPQQIHQRYIAGSAEMPRSYMRRPYELDLEVEGALRAAEQLAPTGKRALLYQWSGDTTPYEAVIRATREAGVRNINGGDSRFDMDYPSVAYVPPIGRPVGAERQIYAVNSNENTYTNDWTGPFYGFRKLEETVRKTGDPRRLKAFNLYYHMYSGEKPAALDAVRQHLITARNGEFIPIAASHYAAIADSFYDVEIRQIGQNQWRIAKRGDLQTLRFDDAAELALDLSTSVGVLGERRHDKTLYVALDPDVEEPVVALGPLKAALFTPQAAENSGHNIQLIASRWRISELTRGDCGFKANAEGFGPGKMAWQGMVPGKYTFAAKRSGKTLWELEVVIDHARRMDVTVLSDAINPLTLELACVSGN